MEKEEYLKLVEKITPKENKFKNGVYAFLIGGTVGLFGEAINKFIAYVFNLDVMVSSAWTCLIVIFLSCLFTGLGFFDNLVSKYKCGLIIPTTGFAHSVMSASLDYKKDGLIQGLGSNFFKLAGSVILYGILSGFVMGIIKVIINV